MMGKYSIKNKNARIKAREYINEYKASHDCLFCGRSDDLTFHHPYPEDRKSYQIADMVRHGISVTKLKKQLSKLVLVCRDCHYVIEGHDAAQSDRSEWMRMVAKSGHFA